MDKNLGRMKGEDLYISHRPFLNFLFRRRTGIEQTYQRHRIKQAFIHPRFFFGYTPIQDGGKPAGKNPENHSQNKGILLK